MAESHPHDIAITKEAPNYRVDLAAESEVRTDKCGSRQSGSGQGKTARPILFTALCTLPTAHFLAEPCG